MNLEPLQDKILVKRVEEEENKDNLIVIPDNAKEKPQMGKVLAVGPGKTLENGILINPTLVVGDTVLFGKYTGTEVEVNNETFLVMREDDVFARVGAN